MQNLENYLETIRTQYHLPALAAALTCNNHVISAVCGVRKIGHSASVTLNDKFRFGSVSKSVTATLIQKLVDGGKLNFEDKLFSFFPNLSINKNYQDVTLAQLLTHTSGLPTEDGLNTPYDNKSNQFYYSNLNYILLGQIASFVTNKSFEQLIHIYINQPFNIEIICDPWVDEIDGIPNDPWGHTHSDTHIITPVNMDNPDIHIPAGRMRASIVDWIKLLQFFLSQKNIVETPYLIVPDDRGQEYTSAGFIRMGSELLHDGGNGFHYARHVILPQQNSALVIATNDGSSYALEAMNKIELYLVNIVMQHTLETILTQSK
ncbi:MAG: beta-lactamase family protein [Alphaproteobacteria bacterium]|nr:beta-lactamase family protein [Alphaproteobacteria bacterium]